MIILVNDRRRIEEIRGRKKREIRKRRIDLESKARDYIRQYKDTILFYTLLYRTALALICTSQLPPLQRLMTIEDNWAWFSSGLDSFAPAGP